MKNIPRTAKNGQGCRPIVQFGCKRNLFFNSIISKLDKDVIVLLVDSVVHGIVQITWNEMLGLQNN